MASIAGDERRHNEHTMDVKYVALTEIDRRLSNKDVSKYSMSQKTPYPRGIRSGKNNRCI